MGETAGSTDEPSTSAKNAWSLPWGTGTDHSSKTSVELAPEKTAEEIKNEVLKAAKERTKAKSKLFPQKANTDIETKVQERIESDKPSSKSDLSKDSKELITTENNAEEDKKVVETEDKNVVETSLSIEQGVKQEDVATEYQEKDIMPHFTKQLETSESDDLRKQNDGNSGSCFEEISEDDKDLNLILDRPIELSGQDSEVRNVNIDVVSVLEPTTDGKSVQEKLVKQPVDNIVETIPEQTAQEDLIKSMSKSDIGGPDISSSVEFVTDQDIELSEPVSAIDMDSCDNVGSDPEIIDICDKVEITGTEVTQDSSDSDIQLTPEDVGVDGDKDKGLDKIPSTVQEDIDVSCAGQISKSENLCDNTTDVIQTQQQDSEKLANIVSSDSESSVSKLDISMDTCTSDETIVDVITPADEEDNQIQTSEGPAILNVKIDDLDEKQKSNDDAASNDLLQISHEVKAMDESEPDSSSPCDKGQLSPANSFVKCMLEDAIDDSKQDDNSDSHSATEKSDGSRSVYSNHESSDEIDTTTSSDIEIISMPTPNGENRQVSSSQPITPFPNNKS